jgi:hypothetical protein
MDQNPYESPRTALVPLTPSRHRFSFGRLCIISLAIAVGSFIVRLAIELVVPVNPSENIVIAHALANLTAMVSVATAVLFGIAWAVSARSSHYSFCR